MSVAIKTPLFKKKYPPPRDEYIISLTNPQFNSHPGVTFFAWWQVYRLDILLVITLPVNALTVVL